ncbi:MAG TPA: D-glycero-beta-D-manno-heptose 1-phosphate adenylyltransferase [Myxococcota bacterium]|nr:D-glycero-beta-D-manno-heptose 1-phosphate adenylyltransferase [Myxococcota bacterium]
MKPRAQEEWSEPTAARARELLGAMLGRRVLVIGDSALDAYVAGEVERISPEAPVPVLAVEREDYLLGGAANVAKCLVALGARTTLCTVVGDDADGELFRNEAEGIGIPRAGILVDRSRRTTRKTRIVARQQQVIRLDRETIGPLSPALEKRLCAAVARAVKRADAVVLSDYSKGVLSAAVCRAVFAAAGARPVLVDPKNLPWKAFGGATILKPNLRAAEAFAHATIEDEASAKRVAARIAEELGVAHVLLTRGAEGMVLASRGSNATLGIAARAKELVDETGAGDVVAAAVALALAAGAELGEAAWLANVAAGVKVGKFGAATVTGQEIVTELGGGEPTAERVMTREDAARLAAKLRAQGRSLVFTNGCFDILHLGHVRYLEASRKLGDALVVGVNTDASVRKLKGPGRPLQSELDRAQILASLSCVDAVVLFAEDTPLALIRALKPDVLTKGADYKTKRAVVGWDLVRKWGGRVELVPLIEGRSTTGLVKRAQT